MNHWWRCGFIIVCSLCLLHLHYGLSQAEDDVLEMRVKGVTLAPDSNAPIVILEDMSGHQAFPIWIGVPEARAIALAMEGRTTPRPLTHKLLKNILTGLQVDVQSITIHDIRDNTFHATILLTQADNALTIDARPSDAIALALQVHAPIFVTQKVLASVHTVTLHTSPPRQPITTTLGMDIQNLDANLAAYFHLSTVNGVLVAAVETGGLASRYGIHRGDVITRLNNTQLQGVEDFVTFFQETSSGQTINVQLMRDRHFQEFSLTLATLD